LDTRWLAESNERRVSATSLSFGTQSFPIFSGNIARRSHVRDDRLLRKQHHTPLNLNFGTMKGVDLLYERYSSPKRASSSRSSTNFM
jgi:hypothetical protein